MVLRKDQLEAKLRDERQMVKSGVLKEENPLDQSPEFDELMKACRRGDLRTCQQLISAGVNINGRDRFDYTPLIIASLCGHYELVRLLLEAGALAERNTFQGERCVYNALNDKIRNLLLQYDFSKSTDPLQAWSAHITSLLSLDKPRTSDIALLTDSHSIALHKFLLSARSPYFQQKLAAAPGTDTWKLPASLPIESCRIVMQYLYLDELPRDVVDPSTGNSEESVLKGIDKISKDLGLGNERLWGSMPVMGEGDRRLTRQRYQDEVNRAQGQLKSFFEEAILGNKMVVEESGIEGVKWPRTNSVFADCIVAAYEPTSAVQDPSQGNVHPAEPRGIPVGPLANGASKSSSRKVVLYPAHKAMLIRSPYFDTMFSSEFKEAQELEHLHVITLDCNPDVLRLILSFLYTEDAKCPLELALDLLYAADMLFLDKLKGMAVTAISSLGSKTANTLLDRTHAGEEAEVEEEPINIYDVIHAAWELRVQRLEEFAARYLANRLEDYIDDEEFAELIRLSAGRIEKREETDTIELLDDIRYYLSERFRWRFEDAGLDVMEEGAEVDALADEMGEIGLDQGETGEKAVGPVTTNNENPEGEKSEVEVEKEGETDVIRTLDGNVVTDEFDQDARNYQILLQKIDAMLERLELDA